MDGNRRLGGNKWYNSNGADIGTCADAGTGTGAEASVQVQVRASARKNLKAYAEYCVGSFTPASSKACRRSMHVPHFPQCKSPPL